MTIYRFSAATALSLTLAFGLHAQAQADAPPPARGGVAENDPLTFDVASVKPAGSCPPACGLIRPMVGAQGYHIEGATVRSMMTVAYTVTDRQITSGPAWMNTDRFDIEAKAGRQRTTDELHIMLQHLLEERFGLKLRHEAREESVFIMTVAKGGIKMPVHDPDDRDYAPIGGSMEKASDGSICPGIAGKNIRMDYLAFFLSRGLDRMVIDRTELPGRYDVKLQFVPDGMRLRADGANGPTISPDCGDLASSMPRQLGLRIEAGKGPVDFLVVEHLDKPSDN